MLKRTRWEGTPALVVGGGSPRATLWAVYELAERWGVRYLTDRDALPQEEREFQVPDLDVLMEPVFRIRAHPTLQDFAPSGEAWGMADFRVLIDQLAKLKFTRMNVYPFGYQPYLQWEHKGIQRRSASLWYEQHFPITPDMIGRELFEDAAEFWNPDLPLGGSYDDLMAAGERQVHNLIEYAHRRGMECDIFAPTIDFPPEFAPLLKGAGRSGQLTVHPGFNTPIDDSSLSELSAAVLQATVNTYPEVDRIMVAMPEKRQWLGQYERAWRELDAKYGISQVRSLDDILAAAENRKGSRRWPGKRGLDQAKADIASLFFYDRLLLDGGVLRDTQRPDIQFVYMEPAEELYPLLDRILPSGWEVGAHPENQPEHFLPRAEVLGTLNTRKIPGIMHVTLDDDVVGLVPQLRPTVLHEFMTQLRRHGWTGFAARERFPADHDAVLAYLAEAGWNYGGRAGRRGQRPDPYGLRRGIRRGHAGRPAPGGVGDPQSGDEQDQFLLLRAGNDDEVLERGTQARLPGRAAAGLCAGLGGGSPGPGEIPSGRPLVPRFLGGTDRVRTGLRQRGRGHGPRRHGRSRREARGSCEARR